jgi:hypothetical protein
MFFPVTSLFSGLLAMLFLVFVLSDMGSGVGYAKYFGYYWFPIDLWIWIYIIYNSRSNNLNLLEHFLL